jgi:hypothetical protein
MPEYLDLPEYEWDDVIKAYRHADTGEVVSDEQMQDLLDDLYDQAADEMAGMARDAVEGKMTAILFLLAAAFLLKQLYNAFSALAVGGWLHMTDEDWLRNGVLLSAEYNYLSGMAQDIEGNKLSVVQADSRIRLYMGRAYARYWEILVRERTMSSMFTEYRWMDTKDERECGDCPMYAAQGWVRIGTFGTVPGAGATACLGACRCWLEFR